MEPMVMKGVQLLLSLSILIVLHELGHFIPAKIFKTRVEKFFLFFDVKFALFKKKFVNSLPKPPDAPVIKITIKIY